MKAKVIVATKSERIDPDHYKIFWVTTTVYDSLDDALSAAQHIWPLYANGQWYKPVVETEFTKNSVIDTQPQDGVKILILPLDKLEFV